MERYRNHLLKNRWPYSVHWLWQLFRCVVIARSLVFYRFLRRRYISTLSCFCLLVGGKVQASCQLVVPAVDARPSWWSTTHVNDPERKSSSTLLISKVDWPLVSLSPSGDSAKIAPSLHHERSMKIPFCARELLEYCIFFTPNDSWRIVVMIVCYDLLA